MIGAAVVGTGFMAVVHLEALRRPGVEVTGVVGSTPERARQKPGLPEAVLAADKHVVCEKPLALTSSTSRTGS